MREVDDGGTDERVRLDRSRYDAVIFDLDGVITRTARIHAAAWKQAFDELLARHAGRTGGAFVPFDADADYRAYVDGKPRYDGVASFLASREIELPYGDPGDEPAAETVCGLGNRKNAYFVARLRRDGVKPYEDAVALLGALREAGFRTAIISASRNCGEVLQATSLEHVFDVRVDGNDAKREGLAGKPAPDIFVAAARRLETPPARAVVVEDAIAGVQAGRAGRFGLVVGADRTGHPEALRRAGAHAVVTKLTDLRVTT